MGQMFRLLDIDLDICFRRMDGLTDGRMVIPPSVPFKSAAQKALQADSKPLLAGPEPIPASSKLHPAGSAALPLSFEIGIVSYGAAAQSLQN